MREPTSPSPYLGWPGRPHLHVFNQLALGLYWFPTNVLWTGLLLVVLPQRVLALVGSGQATAVLSWTNILGVVVAILITPLFGAVSDGWRSRLGRRRPLMVLGTIPALVFVMLIVYARSIPMFLVGLTGVQLFSNIAQSSYQGLIPDLVAPRQRGSASGFMAFYNELGLIIGGVLAAFTPATVFGWAAVSGLGASLIATLGLVREPDSRSLPRTSLAQRLNLASLTGEAYRDFRWVFVTRLLVLIGLYVLQSYLLYYLRFVLHIRNPQAHLFILLIILSLAAMASATFTGFVSDRTGRRRLIVCLSGIVQGVCALLFVFSHSLGMFEIVAALFGIGYGAFQSVDWALVVDTLPGHSAGKDMGLWSTAATGAQLIALSTGYLLAQFVIPLSGLAPAYRLLFGLTCIFFLAGSLLVWKIRSVT